MSSGGKDIGQLVTDPILVEEGFYLSPSGGIHRDALGQSLLARLSGSLESPGPSTESKSTNSSIASSSPVTPVKTSLSNKARANRAPQNPIPPVNKTFMSLSI